MERRGQSTALLLVYSTFRQDQTEPDDPGQELAGPPGFLKIISIGAHDIKQSLVVRRQELALVQKVPEVDETIVGDGLDPLEGQAAAGIVEDYATCIEAALLLVSTAIP